MNLLIVIIFFLLPANFLLLFFLQYREKVGRSLIFFVSYGIAPLLNALIFYYSIWILPDKEDIFYIGIFLFFWIILAIFFRKNVKELLLLYKNIFQAIKDNFNLKKAFFIFPVFLFLSIYLFQIFGYPVIEGDNAFYINQSKGFYLNKNLNWKYHVIQLSEKEDYLYNLSISPGVPSFLALTFSFSKDLNNYFAYNFLLAYYHILLLLFLLFLIKEIAQKLEKPVWPAIFLGLYMFTFSWFLTRMFILGAKESIIYFLAAVSIYIAFELICLNKKDRFFESLLGAFMGLNIFINLHGVIINLILFLILLIFSRLKLFERLKQIIFVFLVQLVFGIFDFITNTRNIFIPIIKKVSEKIGVDSSALFFHKNIKSLFGPEAKKIISQPISNVDIHKELYGFKNYKDVYIRGKLQLLSNVGVFGFYFWLFLGICFSKIREIISSKLGKIILIFISFYIFIVLDPLSINQHPLTIVLSGSTKYAGMVFLLSISILSVYAYSIFDWFWKYIKKNRTITVLLLSIFVIIILIFYRNFEVLGLKLLGSVIVFYKDVSFYRSKIDLFLVAALFFPIVILFSLALLQLKKESVAKNLVAFILIVFFILMPFFIIEVGKVPLSKTFSYLNKSQRFKLENAVNLNEIQKVYFFSKDNLVSGTVIETSFNELYLYNNGYFNLTRRIIAGSHYQIDHACDGEIIYRVSNTYLCKTE